jgi:hypothetical protein
MSKVTLLTDRTEIQDAKEVRWNQNGAQRHSFISDSDRSNIFIMPDLEVTIIYPYFDGFHRLRNGLERRDQNPLPDNQGALPWRDWKGNFEPEEALLWTGSQGTHDGPLKIIFHPANGKKVMAVGLQLQVACKGKFTTVMDVYDSAGHFLDELSREGLSTDHFDAAHPENNAPFIGVSGSDICRIELSTKTICAGGFCINQLFIDY